MSAMIHHPRMVELVKRAKLRQQVERAVAHLIAILDELDGDPDLEPWIGAPERMAGNWNPRAVGANDDREDPDEDGGDIVDQPHDAEPGD